MTAPAPTRKNRRTALVLGGVVVGMFGFGFAMVPLYNLLCQLTGVQSVEARSSLNTPAAAAGSPVSERWVTVKFDGTVNASLPWEFEPMVRKLRVHPGEAHVVTFRARNLATEAVTGQAIPSVVPWQATGYFSKQECFCFNQQRLEAGASEEMPLRFVVSPDLPEGINSLTLSYNFLRVENPPAQDIGSGPGSIPGQETPADRKPTI